MKHHGQNIAGEIIPLPGDVTNKDSVAKLVSTISDKEGYLDILVNDAGIAPGKEDPKAEDAEGVKSKLFDVS